MQTHPFLPDAIRALVEEYADREGIGPMDINRGDCEAFAEEVMARLADPALEPMEASSFATPDGGLDRDMLSRLFPGLEPPLGLDLDDLEDLGMGEVAHAWVFHGGRHYDAEAPDGVDSPFDLPVLRREAASGVLERWPEKLPALEGTEWWQESVRLRDQLLEARHPPVAP